LSKGGSSSPLSLRKEKFMTKTNTTGCTTKECGQDCLSKFLARIGFCRSTLVTLALVPFAWNGVTWAIDAVKSVFDLVSGVAN